MNDDFFIGLERLELISFFAGFPLLYFLIHFFADFIKDQNKLINKLKLLLPYAYALTGLAFIGYILYNLYPDFSFKQIKDSNQLIYLKIWAFTSILFFIPFFAQKPIYSLLHSLVFFFLLLQDFFHYLSGNKEMLYPIKNDMKVYTDSLLLQAMSLLVVFVLIFVINRIRREKQNR